MTLSKVLLESRKDDFLRKFKSKFTPEQFKRVFMLSRELSSNQKYLMFLGKVLTEEDFEVDIRRAENIIKKFTKYQQALTQRDINQYETLDDIVSAINTHENKVRRDVEVIEGADVVFENDRFTVVTPKTHTASCYYGSGTKWCTAALNGRSHFEDYNTDGKLFYILDKKAKSSDRFYKVAALRKYDGDITYYDAPDKVFNRPEWKIGDPQMDDILRSIDEYISSNYSREVGIFKDAEKAKAEKERLRKISERLRIARELQTSEDRKENDEWNLENTDSIGEKANAVYYVIQTGYLVVDEDEEESIYNLVPQEYDSYGLTTFKWLGDDDTDSIWSVGTYDEAYEAAIENQRNLWDDMGAEAYNQDWLSSHIDNEAISEYFTDMWEEDVSGNPEVYFSEDELPLSSEQESEIEKLKEEKVQLEEDIEYTDDEDEEELAQDRIDEIESELEDITDSPNGEPTEEMVDNKVEELVSDAMYDVISTMADYGLDIGDYIDTEDLFKSTVDTDGIGHGLSTYDGVENEANINGTDYYVFKLG